MDDRVIKNKLSDNIREGRARWEGVLAEVGEERMLRPGAEGDWSVKDIIAHVNFWERMLVNRLQAAQRNQAPPATPELDDKDTDEGNAWIYEQVKGLPLRDVLAESTEVYRQLLDTVQALSEEDLIEPGRFEWMDGAPLWKAVPGDNYEHYRDHEASIRAWLGRQ